MRNKLSVFSQPISKGGVDTLNLPRNSVHDAYILRFNIRVHNGKTESITPTPKDILDAIAEIRLVTDSTRVHYDITGHDLAILNALMQKNNTHPFIDQTLDAVAANADKEYEFCLYLDEGDIIATAHTNVELTVHFKDESSMGLTVTSAQCLLTIKESLMSQAELVAKYGEGLKNAAEPKVYIQTTKCNGNTEFSGFFDLPTGTLLRKGILYITNNGKLPDQIGILRTNPDRVELNKEDFLTHIELDQIIYGTELPYKYVKDSELAAVYVIDYGTQWQSNGIGKNGWSFAKGDIMLAAKTPADMNVRYLSIESMVNTSVYPANLFTEY